MTTTRTRLWTVEEYHRMAEAEILHPEERVELIEGEIITMAAKNPPHSAITKTTADYLRNLLEGLADIRIQEPIYLNQYSEPEPDIAVVRIDPRNYIDHHPRPEEVFLLLEVAETTLLFDRKRKAASYAKAQIADYWVIDVKQEQVFVLRQPGANTYQQESVWDKNATLSLIAFPNISVSLEKFFP